MNILNIKLLSFKDSKIPDEWYFSVQFSFKSDNYEYFSYKLLENVSIIQFPIYLEYNNEFLVSVLVKFITLMN